MSEPSTPEQVVEQQDTRSVAEVIRAFGLGSDIKILLRRIEPKIVEGVVSEGVLKEYTMDEGSEPPSELAIGEEFGGGKYEIQGQRRNAKGQIVTLGRKRFPIPGRPKLAPRLEVTPVPATPGTTAATGEPPSIAIAAMNLASQTAERERSSREAAEARAAKSGISDALLHDLVGAVGKKDDTLMEAMQSERSQHHSELSSLRQGHDQEMRSLRERYAEDHKRAEDRMDREVKAVRDAHAREIENLKHSYEMQIKNMDAQQATKQGILEARIEDLRDELTSARNEVIELRGRKEKGLTEQLDDMVKIREVVGEHFGADKDEEPEHWAMQVLGKLEPLISGIGDRVAHGGAGGGPPPLAQRPNRPLRKNQPRAMPTKKPEVQAAGAPASAPAPEKKPEPAAPPKPADDIRQHIKITEKEFAAAIAFVENCCAKGVPPAEMALTLKTQIPGDLLKVINRYGITGFLDLVEKSKPQSPLVSIVGRDWCEEVFALVLPKKKPAAEEAKPAAG